MKKVLLILSLLVSSHVVANDYYKSAEYIFGWQAAAALEKQNFWIGFLANVYSDNEVKEKSIFNAIGLSYALLEGIITKTALDCTALKTSTPLLIQQEALGNNMFFAAKSLKAYALGALVGTLVRKGANKLFFGPSTPDADQSEATGATTEAQESVENSKN